MEEYMDDDLIYNTSTRIPVCICIDTSGSMRLKDKTEFSRIERVRDGIKELFKEILADNQTKNSAEIAIVTFNETANVVRNFKLVGQDEKVQRISTGSKGDLGIGVLESLKILNARKQLYKENGVDYYQPVLIIMSDGCPTGDDAAYHAHEAEEEVLDLESNNKLTIIPIFIGTNADQSSKGFQTLQKFSKVNTVCPVGAKKYLVFFRLLSKSFSQVRENNGIKLDLTELDNWDEI